MSKRATALPRELASGVWWIADCLGLEYEGEIVHGYNSVYLVQGEERTLIVDGGHPKDWETVDAQLDKLVAAGAPPVEYLFPTHAEVAHSANLGRLLEKFPGAVIVGDTRDYHLVFPEHEDRLRPMPVGSEIDLGGTTFVILEAVIRDLVNTVWGYDTARRVLFPGDGFAYVHHHRDGECGLTSEEVPDLPLEEFTALFAEYALYWTRFTDLERHIAELDSLLTMRYPVDVIAPGHGSPIMHPDVTVPKVKTGLRLGGTTR